MKEQAEIMELEMKVKDEYGAGFAPYKRHFEHLFVVADETRYFKQTDRMRIIIHAIRSPRRQNGADLSPFGGAFSTHLSNVCFQIYRDYLTKISLESSSRCMTKK